MILGVLFFGGRLTRLGILALVVSHAEMGTVSVQPNDASHHVSWS